MPEDEKIKAGIAAIKSGDRSRAAAIFADVVKVDPSSESGWYLLGISCTAPDQREYCFRRVLKLNPGNQDAIKQLASVSKPAAVTPPAWSSQPPPIHNTAPPKAPLPEPPAASPYADEQSSERSAEKIIAPASAQIQPKKNPTARPKKSNRALIISLVAVPVLAGCGLVAAYFLFPNQVIAFISPSAPVIETPAPQVFLQPTQTEAPSLATLSPTALPPTVLPSPMPTVSYTPLLERSDCPFDAPANADVDCAYVIVPEDRSGDRSHTIRLAVAVYHSTSSKPSSDPVIFLQGGPGGEALQLSADAFDYLVAPFLSKRDFIVFDQRGTGSSKPILNCDELKKIYSQDIHGLIPSTTRELVYSNAFLSCNGLMQAQGVKLNAYTTVESAADLRDILTVLGYQKVNLYGASYGTRLAQVVMRDYPQFVRSAILDSVVPIQSNLFTQYPDSSESALKELFSTCASSPECNSAYPNLEKVFWDLVAELDANPVTVTTSYYPVGTITETVNGSAFMSVILGSIKSSDLLSTAPQTIHRFEKGDYSTLIAAQYSLPFAFETVSPGLYISMMCHEHILTTTVAELQAISTRRGVQDYGWLPFYGNADNIFKTCKSWGAVGPDLGENDPLVSDIPSLIITGKFDPVTPPDYGRQIAAGLSHSYYFEFPNLGHTPTGADSTGCAMHIAAAFIQDPSTEPDRSCMKKLEKVDFLIPYTGDPPLSLNRTTVMGVSVSAPKGWYDLGDGFFLRGNSSLDITQIGVLQARVSAAELKDWFSLGAYGYRGLDSAPLKAAERAANGMNWTLYTATSNGRPVDIAMADRGENVLVILLFSHIDERDALYQTVFLPMVDSAK